MLGRLGVALAFLLPASSLLWLSVVALPYQDASPEIADQHVATIGVLEWGLALSVVAGLCLGVAGTAIQLRLRRQRARTALD
ncbi:hypothetical protein AB0J90_01110 [Micromonospora sp. NPDC049523]|uniref:hypothetical protein n=1 Tax=Micromonospora sp. NPDC049523 TaxID=3155921 RepID=UPI00343BB8B6